MFYYLSEYTQWFSPLRVFQYVTFRAVCAALTALLMVDIDEVEYVPPAW